MEPLGGDGLKFFGEMTFAFVLLIGLAVIIAFFVLCVLLIKTSLDKGTQRKTTENELPSLTQCTA